MANGHIVLLIITLTCLSLGLAGVIAGAYGRAWLVNDVIDKAEKGLWKKCEGDHCVNRKDIFKFDSKMELDVILTLLIGSGAFCLLGIASSLFMFCCYKNLGLWRCCAVFMMMITLLGAFCGLGAVIYNEWYNRDFYKTSKHGWSVIVAWVGAVIQLLGAIFASFLICNAPQLRFQSRSTTINQPNKGYEMM